jgi:hypothetical protein
MSRFTTPSTGTPGPQGPKGDPGDTPDFSSITEDVLPSQDNVFVLGNSDYRWKSISLGEGTIYITDTTLGTQVGITVDNGVFFIDGVAQAQLPDLAVTNLTFNDNTVQTTAAVAQVNSDWNSTSGKSQILNKPDLSTVGVPVEVDYEVGGGTMGAGAVQPTFSSTPMFDGSYVKTGPLVYFRVNVDMSNITNFGSGQYYLTLPFNAKYDVSLNGGHLHDNSTNNNFVIHGEAEAGTNVLALSYIGSNGQNEIFDHNSPVTLQNVDFFHVSGTYISE